MYPLTCLMPSTGSTKTDCTLLKKICILISWQAKPCADLYALSYSVISVEDSDATLVCCCGVRGHGFLCSVLVKMT